MSAPDPETLARLAAAFQEANQREAYAHGKYCEANESMTLWDKAHREAANASRAARTALLEYSLNGGSTDGQ